MPRVMQWAQNHNLNHFATPYDNQNTRPYWAELGILHLRTLWGGDTPASLVQLFCLVGSMIAAAGAVRLLGKGRLAQWVAALFVFSLPMGVLQVTTPKNDIVAGYWTLSLLYFVVLSKKRGLSRFEWAGLSLSLGIGMLTKGTFILFTFPIMVWFFLARIFRQSIRKTASEIGILALAVVVLNGAFWTRNIRTYGGPYGSRIPLNLPFIDRTVGDADDSEAFSPVSPQTGTDGGDSGQYAQGGSPGNEILSKTDPENSNLEILPEPTSTGPVLERLGKLARMAAMNWTTPVSALNEIIFRVLETFPRLFPENFVDSLRGAVWNYAMTSGNPLHFLLITVAAITALISSRMAGFDLRLQVVVVALAGYLLISLGGCSDVIVCMRYQLPFFVVGGVVLGSILPDRLSKLSMALAVVLLLYSLPYIFINNMRPVIGMKPWPTRINSVFEEEPETILYAHFPGWQDEHEWIAAQIVNNQCTQVGLVLAEAAFEYPYWWLLDAPQSGIQFQHIKSSAATERYMDSEFQPCAVICLECTDARQVAGLPLISNFGHVQYFASSQ
jgi:hypothetical protein